MAACFAFLPSIVICVTALLIGLIQLRWPLILFAIADAAILVLHFFGVQAYGQ